MRPWWRVPEAHGVAEVLAHHGVRPEVAPVPEGHARPVGGAPGLESGVLGDSDDADARLAVLVLRGAHIPGALNRLLTGPSISSPSGLHRVRQLASQSAVHRHPKRLAAHLGITSALLTRPTPPATLIWARVAMDLP